MENNQALKGFAVIPHWAFMRHHPSWAVFWDAKGYHRNGALCHTTAIKDL